MLPRFWAQRDEARRELAAGTHPLMPPSDDAILAVQLALAGRIRLPNSEAALRAGLTTVEGLMLDKELGRGPGPGELWWQHMSAKSGQQADEGTMQISPLLDSLLQGAWRTEVIDAAGQAYRELRTLNYSAKDVSLTYLHPEPIVRAPRRLYGSPAREIPEMRLDELFTTDLKAPSERQGMGREPGWERVHNVRRKMIGCLMPDHVPLPPVPVKLHSTHELAVFLKLMADHHKFEETKEKTAKEKTRTSTKSDGIIGAPTKAFSLPHNDPGTWRKDSVQGAMILVERVHSRTQKAGSLQVGRSVSAECLLPVLELPPPAPADILHHVAPVPAGLPPAVEQLVKHVASKQGTATIWVPPDEACIIAAMKTIQLASDAVARSTPSQYVQVTPAPASAFSEASRSEARQQHALAVVLTRVTQTHERPSAFRFTSSLQRIVDGLGEEWKSAHQRRLKQWSHKNLGALFVLRGEKHKDRSEAQQVYLRDFAVHHLIWFLLHNLQELGQVLAASRRHPQGLGYLDSLYGGDDDDEEEEDEEQLRQMASAVGDDMHDDINAMMSSGRYHR